MRRNARNNAFGWWVGSGGGEVLNPVLTVLIPVGLLVSAWLLVRVFRRVGVSTADRPSTGLLVVGLFLMPVLVLAGTSSRMVSGMKEVEACGSCHVMDRFVTDLLDTASMTLAARHFRADSMPGEACYACHTGYGVFGSVQAKRDGMLHWWRFVTTSWEDPIEIHGGYPNANCMACHPYDLMYADSIPLHVALQDSLVADVITCFMCHGDPHARLPGAVDSVAEPFP